MALSKESHDIMTEGCLVIAWILGIGVALIVAFVLTVLGILIFS
jgi:hypothetical protein